MAIRSARSRIRFQPSTGLRQHATEVGHMTSNNCTWRGRKSRHQSIIAANRVGWAARDVVQALERRTLLAAQLTAIIPGQIDPTTAPQALFAPGVSTYALSAVNTTGAATYY